MKRAILVLLFLLECFLCFSVDLGYDPLLNEFSDTIFSESPEVTDDQVIEKRKIRFFGYDYEVTYVKYLNRNSGSEINHSYVFVERNKDVNISLYYEFRNMILDEYLDKATMIKSTKLIDKEVIVNQVFIYIDGSKIFKFYEKIYFDEGIYGFGLDCKSIEDDEFNIADSSELGKYLDYDNSIVYPIEYFSTNYFWEGIFIDSDKITLSEILSFNKDDIDTQFLSLEKYGVRKTFVFLKNEKPISFNVEGLEFVENFILIFNNDLLRTKENINGWTIPIDYIDEINKIVIIGAIEEENIEKLKISIIEGESNE